MRLGSRILALVLFMALALALGDKAGAATYAVSPEQACKLLGCTWTGSRCIYGNDQASNETTTSIFRYLDTKS